MSFDFPQPRYRVSGKAKAQGQAKFSAEFRPDGMAYACLVQSTIAKGRIESIDFTAAGRLTGVLAVLTPANAPRLPNGGNTGLDDVRTLTLLQDSLVHYHGQPIAVVVAGSLEQAKQAGSLLSVKYAPEPADLSFQQAVGRAEVIKEGLQVSDSMRGDIEGALGKADVKVAATYTTPIENHNPIEPHATLAQWDGDKLLVHEPTQWLTNNCKVYARTFGIPEQNVRVISEFVGGSFGCKGSVWSHAVLAAMAARVVDRPVRLALERKQMFTIVGARPRTQQKITLGAARDGKLLAVRHDVVAHTAHLEEFLESSAQVTRRLYASEATATSHRLVRLNVTVPHVMRAPGEATGLFALEVAMDELADALRMDPVELRLKNFAERDPSTNKPFSSNHLRECYSRGAERFGWHRRSPEPRSMKEGDLLLGWGMATATFPGYRLPSTVMVRVRPDGSALVASGSHDMGTGTYSTMSQVASLVLGIDIAKIEAKLGDSSLPEAAVAGGSMTTASVCPAVHSASTEVKEKIVRMAIGDPRSPLFGAAPNEIESRDGVLFRASAQDRAESYTAVLGRNGGKAVEATSTVGPEKDIDNYSVHSFGAVFAEVLVDPDLCTVRVKRMTAVYDVGALVNKTAGRNQLVGGIVMGIGAALLEETQIDENNGRIVNANLADYHLPVNTDIGEIDVTVLGIPDRRFNPLGVRGIGELGITGVAGAVANAVYHATGKRVRDLPITPNKLL